MNFWHWSFDMKVQCTELFRLKFSEQNYHNFFFCKVPAPSKIFRLLCVETSNSKKYPKLFNTCLWIHLRAFKNTVRHALNKYICLIEAALKKLNLYPRSSHQVTRKVLVWTNWNTWSWLTQNKSAHKIESCILHSKQ